MITIFAVPRGFSGQFNAIQRNAIQSWLRLRPECEIILFGIEDGLAEAAKEFGVKYIPDLKKNEFGTPYLNDAYNQAQKSAKFPMVAYVNSDIILLNDFLSAVKKIEFPKFMMVGRRWNLDLKEEINFNDFQWENKLRENLKKNGKLHTASGMDYCLFPKDFSLNLPPFTTGRTGGSDSWQLYRAHCSNLPIIDATKATTVIHQSHESASFHFAGQKGEQKIIETQRNLVLRGRLSTAYNLRDADWILAPSGLKKRRFFPFSRFFYRFCGGLLTCYPILSKEKKALLFPAWFLLRKAKKLRDSFI